MATVEIGGDDGDDGLYLTAPLGNPGEVYDPTPGAMIYDRNGSLVWIGTNLTGPSVDLQLQEYDGQPVLTFYNGTLKDGHGQGTVRDSGRLLM